MIQRKTQESLTMSTPLLSSITTTTRSNESNPKTLQTSNRFDFQETRETQIIINPKLKSQPFRPLAVLSAHSSSVSCLALCGEFLLSASQGKDIIVWQQPDLRIIAKFGQGEGSIKSLITVGNRVLTAHQDSRIRVWKVSRKSENVFRLMDTLPTTKDYLSNFMKHSNYVQTRRNHKCLWIEHVDSISCLAVTNGLIYSGSWDKTIKIWRLSDLKCLESIKAHDDAINGLVSSNGIIYSASADGKIKAWGRKSKEKQNNGKEKEVSSHVLKGIMEGRKDVSFNSVIVSEDGKWVYGGGSDGFVKGWQNVNFVSWKSVCEIKAHDRAVLCLCLCGKEIMCSGSADNSIGIWKIEGSNSNSKKGNLSKIGVINGHEGPVKCLQASYSNVGDGFLLYSGGLDKSIRVWWVPKNYDHKKEQNPNSIFSWKTPKKEGNPKSIFSWENLNDY